MRETVIVSSWLTQGSADVKALVDKIPEVAPLTLRGLMARAGLTAQSLGHWRCGRSLPHPESLESVAHVLILHGERLRILGRELLDLARAEERQRSALATRDVTDELSLFDPETAAPGR